MTARKPPRAFSPRSNCAVRVLGGGGELRRWAEHGHFSHRGDRTPPGGARVGREYSARPPHPMKSIETILSRHPFPSGSTLQAALVPALQALGACVEACTSCADACLAEQGVDHLRRCIRLNLDCADICMTTARILARQTETVGDLLHAQLHACVLACAQCADECHRHRKMHEHCLHCERHCRECQEACNLLIGELTSAGITPAAESDDV